MIDPVVARRRMLIMGALTAVAVLAALAAIVAWSQGLEWAVFAFAAALVVGFGAQIWFIVGLRRLDRGA